MNKHKKNLEALRRHLGRDAAGLKYLDAIGRDITELRKRAASLEESEGQALAIVARKREETVSVQVALTQARADLEKETGRRIAAQALADRHADRVAVLEQEADVEDEAPLEGPVANDIHVQDIVKLFKAVRKRFKRVPPPSDKRAVLYVEDLAPNLTTDELLGLGMLAAAIAMHGIPVGVGSERTIKNLKGWNPRNSAKFIHWISGWIGDSKLNEKIRAETAPGDVPLRAGEGYKNYHANLGPRPE